MSFDENSLASIELAKEAALKSCCITHRDHFKDYLEPPVGDTRNPTLGT